MNNQKTCGNMSTTSYKRDCSMNFVINHHICIVTNFICKNYLLDRLQCFHLQYFALYNHKFILLSFMTDIYI